MSDRKTKISFSKRAMHLIASPFRQIYGATFELWISVKEIGGMLIPSFLSGRRNRNFEEAGREPTKLVRRRTDDSAFRKGERERKKELVEAERESRKYANANSEEAIHYREQLERRKLDVSRGEIVNHLAKINAKYRKSEAREDETGD